MVDPLGVDYTKIMTVCKQYIIKCLCLAYFVTLLTHIEYSDTISIIIRIYKREVYT